MPHIATGSITLTPVNDAYTVSLTKQSCVIHADFDGSNPQLNDAFTTIRVSRGDKQMKFRCEPSENNNSEIKFSINQDSQTSFTITITKIPSDVLSGSVMLNISTEDGYATEVSFTYSVARESSMLDWIKDWEGSKTKIGGTYVMTPKMFIGKKDQFVSYSEGSASSIGNIISVPGLTGVYIGPDSESTGLYGYKNSREIFHINENGGMIGGWNIESDGIFSKNGLLRIQSNGSIRAISKLLSSVWELNSDGSAMFANGNVQFHSNGNAEFSGEITSSAGTIGGWSITKNQLSQGGLVLDSKNGVIGIVRGQYVTSEDTGEYSVIDSAKISGGVAMYCSSPSDWGIVGYRASSQGNVECKVFSVGSSNMIAGWNFDDTALWLGVKTNTQKAYSTGGITIGTEGMRGNKWYIDSSGDVSLMGGKIQFSAADNGGHIVGWTLNDKRFSTNNAAIISEKSNTGVYLSASDSAAFNSLASSSLAQFIRDNGGLYINTMSGSADLAAFNSSGHKLFQVQSNGISSIAGWNFDDATIYSGERATTGFAKPGYITIGPTGLRGHQWRFEQDGSGAIAGGNIEWDSKGKVTLSESVQLNWKNLDGTIIDKDGLFARGVSANNIAAGTIRTADITNQEETWYLRQDGSGALANGSVVWDKVGNLAVLGSFSQKLHFIYKSDAIAIHIDSTPNNYSAKYKLNKQLYVVTNSVDESDKIYVTEDPKDWPYQAQYSCIWKIVLPNDASYIGKEVKIYDCNYGPFTRATQQPALTEVTIEDGGVISSDATIGEGYNQTSLCKSIEFRGGHASFVGLPPVNGDVVGQKVHWACLSLSGNIKQVTDKDGVIHDLRSLK